MGLSQAMKALLTGLLMSTLLGSAASVKDVPHGPLVKDITNSDDPQSPLVKDITNSVTQLKNVARHAVQLDGAEAPAGGAGGSGGAAFLQQSPKPVLNQVLKEEQPSQLSEHQKAVKPEFMQAREQEQPNQLPGHQNELERQIVLHQPEASLVQMTMVHDQKEHIVKSQPAFVCDQKYDGVDPKVVEKYFDANDDKNIDKDECDNIKHVFKYFDADGDDKLGADEWKKMEDVIKLFDADGNGRLDKGEMAKLKAALKEADADGNGKLDDKEIAELKKKNAKAAGSHAVSFSLTSSIAVVVLVHLH